MLTREEIENRIAARRKPNSWVEARMDRLGGLDSSSRGIGHLLIGHDETGERAATERGWRLRQKGALLLQALDEPALLRLGEALLPGMTDVFHRAWKLFERIPYQSGYVRKPFRAPRRPDLLKPRRCHFLADLVTSLEGLDEDLPWIAAHAPHLDNFGAADHFAVLLAAGIDLGGPRGAAVEQILRDSAEGTQEVGQMGRHVIGAFLCSAKRDCWEYVEKLLLAAQRQEGLRQVILESIDFSHPDAFRRMLRTIVEKDLVRFSATVRAADVWLGLQLDSQSARYVNEVLESLIALLDDEAARRKTLTGNDGAAAYFALWSIAFEDAPDALTAGAKLLRHKKPELRFAAVHLLGMLGLPDAFDGVLPAVDDADLRVAAYAAAVANAELSGRVFEERVGSATADDTGELSAPGWHSDPYWERVRPPVGSGDLFERLVRLYERTPAKAKDPKPLVWPWLTVKAERKSVASGMVMALGDRPPATVLPYLDELSPEARQWVASLLGRQPTLDGLSRKALLRLVGDAAGGVREAAVRAMTRIKIEAGDLPALEPLLARKGSDLRRGVLGLIRSLKDADVLASAGRLMAAKGAALRRAGLDLLQQMQSEQRSVDKVRAAAEAYRAARPKLERDEQVYLDKLLGAQAITLTLDDALGLMDPAKRTPPTPPQDRGTKLGSPAGVALVNLIDDLVHERRDEPITLKRHGGDTEEQPLGSIRYGFPSPRELDRTAPDGYRDRMLDELPLREVWFEAWANRPAAARDADRLEAVRARLYCSLADDYRTGRRKAWQKELLDTLFGPLPQIRYCAVVSDLLEWLIMHETHGDLAGFVVDGFETLLAAVPPDKIAEKAEFYDCGLREVISDTGLLTGMIQGFAEKKAWSAEHTRRMFGLHRWVDEPGVAVPRSRVNWSELVAAFDAGWANEHDVFDSLLGPRKAEEHQRMPSFSDLHTASAALRRVKLSAAMAAIIGRAVERVLEVELARGESETVATPAALALSYAGGVDDLIRVLQAIGRDPKLQRSCSWGAASQGKSVVFSHLIRVTMPGKDDMPDEFVRAVKAAGIDEDALLAVAFYAPQWARFVEAAVGWPVLAEAVWWFHAHTKDNNWRVEQDIRESWNAEIRKLTPLTLEDLVEGAVDVDWFNRTHEVLGRKRWERLDEFAKYASGGGGHKRAQLFADAMLNKLKKAALVKDIEGKRKQDAVRALGLLPLDAKSARKDVLERFKRMQEFVRTSRQFGSQRQASERLAARIGQENLARTAGYPDPIRLQWAMEGLATADLASGPVTVKVKDVTVSLAIDADGRPEISVARGAKPLKSLPPEVKKDAAVAELSERKTELRRSASRMRQSLELAMCRGDAFSGAELLELMGNAILRPMLERLVFVGEGILGYPVAGGKSLRDHADKIEPVRKSEALRLAHPVDLLATKKWTHWQRDCFAAERVQPFKQVFRELYVLTAQEKSDATFSRRYSGQQVNPRQALALLGGRGWVAAPEAGVFRTFHDEKLVAWIEFMETFYTPADVEGLTVEKVRFARRGAEAVAKLAEVPPRLLSEVLRDVDLIVSVAHRGGVDPEASASTVELRAALLRETVQMLKLGNVNIKAPHIHIRGAHAEYSVHLGSATTHMLPGGTLVIVPVHSQHRGRIFLPFADDDPKTAEIVSKVLLLARDGEIQDPNLLEQIRARR